MFYDINLEVDGKVPRANRTSLIKSSTSKDTISNPAEKVKTKFSKEDTEYLELAKNPEQNEGKLREMVDEAAEKSFSNSKVRGSDGKLRLVYHGTVNDFTVFNRQFANIEGDFGKGYYFTSNEYDVDANYATEEGPDLKNKIAHYADKLEWDDEYSGLSYEKREEMARQKFITSEPNIIDAYLNIENPVYITPDEQGTLLDFNENYDEEYDEYGEPEGLLVDFIEALNNIAYDYAYDDVDFNFLYEYAYDNGGVFASDAVGIIKRRIVDELTDENGDLAINEVIRLAFEEIGFDGIIDTSVYYKFRNMNGMDSGTTHYIVFNSNQISSADPVTYDDKGNVIPLSQRFNTENDDIRYSLKDSEGNTLTEAQQEYFKDSKVRDKNGNLLVMYQGAKEDFSVFNRKKSSYANLYGRGFYFTKSKNHASQYGNTRAYYLNIKHPVSTTETTITKSQLRKFLQAVIENEDYSFENYGYGATVDSVLKSTYGKSDFLMLNDISQTAIGDLVEAIELFNKVNGANYDGIMLDTETVTFISEQAKLTTNTNPTSNPDIRYAEKESTNIYEIMGERDAYKKRVEKLEADYERLKERLKLEGRVTNGKYFSENSLLKVADILRKKGNSDIDKVTLGRELKEFYTFIKEQGEKAEWNEIEERSYRIAEMIFNEAKPLTVANDYAQSVLRDIKKTRISLSDAQKQEAQYRFGKNWNRGFFGRTTITNDGIPLESQWQEWAEQYPDFFKADISETDMPYELNEIINTLQDTSAYIVEYDKAEYLSDLAVDIYTNFWTISALKTTADKYTEKIKALDIEHRNAMKELRADFEERLEKQRIADDIHYGRKMNEQKGKFESELAEQRNAQRERYRELYRDLRDRKDSEIAQAKQHGREMLDKFKDRAERTTLLQSVVGTAKALNKKLTTNSKDVHVPEVLKPVVVNLLNSIDFSSKQLLGMKGTRKDMRGTPTKADIAIENELSKVHSMLGDTHSLKMAIQDARKMFEKAQAVQNGTSDGETDSSVAILDTDLIEDIDRLIIAIDILEHSGESAFVLQKMDTNHLKTLNSVVKSINHWAIVADKALANKHKKRISDMSMQTIDEIDILGERQGYSEGVEEFKNFFNWSNILPVNAFKRLGNAPLEMFDSLRDAQDKVTFNRQEVMDFTEKTFKGHDIKKWREDVKTFDLNLPNGKKKTVSMPVSYIMALHCVSKQEDAQRHLYGEDKFGNKLTYKDKNGKQHDGGGFVIKEYKDGVLKVSKDLKATIINEDIVKQITSVLTKEQIAVADAMQEYMNTKGSEWGDSVSMALYGIKKFNVENYFPITVNAHELSANKTKDRTENLFHILNYGFTKERNPKANQSIELGDIFDIFANHMNMVAIYNAYALSIYDVARWYDFKSRDDSGELISVRQSIENAFGKGATTYVSNLITDLNGQHQSSRLGFIGRIFKNTKVAMVGNSLSVTLLQPTAYFKAMTLINPKNLFKSAMYVKDFGASKGVEKAKKYCGIALLKSQGYFETGVSSKVTTKMLHDESVKEKIIEWSLKGAEFMDERTWGVLWNACEFEIRETRKDLKAGSKEYYEVVADKLRDVIYETQVVDSPLTKSDLMRSGDTGAKMVTMFASEITVAYNMVANCAYDTMLDVKKNGKEGALKRNGKKILMTLTAYTLTSAVASILQTAVQAFRDDDDEKTLDDYIKQYFANFISDWLIIGKIPYFKEAISLAQGYSSQRVDTIWLESAFKAYRYYGKAIEGKEGALEKAIDETLKSASYISGVAAYNQWRDLRALLESLGIID